MQTTHTIVLTGKCHIVSSSRYRSPDTVNHRTREILKKLDQNTTNIDFLYVDEVQDLLILDTKRMAYWYLLSLSVHFRS